MQVDAVFAQQDKNMHANHHDAACQSFRRMNRRGMLRGAMAGAGSIASAAALPASFLTACAENLAQASEKTARPKSLLMIWLQGGPSQLETFDPHPGGIIGGDTKAIRTSVKGLDIADTMPATAELMHQATLVRSVVSKEGDHERATYNLKTGWRPDPTIIHPAIGSIVSHQSQRSLDIPRHISISASQWPARGGYLGPEFDAYQVGDPEKPVPNLTSRVPEDRMASRVGPLLAAVENEFQRGRMKNLDTNRTLHQTATNHAVRMMASEQLDAFNIAKESQSTRDAFGDTEFGRGLLAAIRLLDVGVRCVEVELSGWDSHINNHQLQSGNASVLDTALSATMKELVARDMLDDTVVFCGGEFGRTPKINAAAGRDHWPHGFSAFLAGGRLRRGHVHGETTPNLDAEQLKNASKLPQDQLVSDPITVAQLHATLLHATGINPADERTTPIGRPLRWSDGEAIGSLLS
ncbi:MAG: DUF1501 domain-containing protein [Aureliella sp.]